MARRGFSISIVAVLLTMYVVLCIPFKEPKFGLRYNSSDSMPYSLFLRVKAADDSVPRNTIISFNHPQCGIRLAKCVGGVAGDSIKLIEDRVYVNDVCIGPIHRETPSGKLLTPIQEGSIPSGYVFVYGLHPQSFDSRYAEFGLIEIKEIKDVLWPIF